MICEILAAGLTGGGTAREELMDQETIVNNMLMIVIDPKGFGDGIPFRDEIDQLVEHVSSSKTAVGFDRYSVPGDPEREAAAACRANGLKIDITNWTASGRDGQNVGWEKRGSEVYET